MLLANLSMVPISQAYHVLLPNQIAKTEDRYLNKETVKNRA